MKIIVTDLLDGVTPETQPVTIKVTEGIFTGGGGGAVDSVNAQTGVVVLAATDVGADSAGTATAAVATHAGLSDPHPGYLTPAEGNAAYDALGAAVAAVSALGDLATQAELDAHVADTTSVHGIADTTVLATDAEVATAVSDHAAAANPHPTYLTQAEGDAAYDATGAATAAQAAAIAAAATDATTKANAAQAAAVQRANHTGSQAISTVTSLQTALDDKAPLASPALTGNPTAPTQSAGNNSTRLATTAYVDTASGLLVPKSLFDANTMLYATTDDTPAALTVAASRIVGRKASGDIGALTPAEALAVLSGGGTPTGAKFLRDDNTLAVPGGGSTKTVLSDTFNRANGAVGNADGGPLQRYFSLAGTFAITSNALTESSAGAERFIGAYVGYANGLRTHTIVLKTKPASGDGGYFFRADATPQGVFLNVEAAVYKLYLKTGAGTYTAQTPVSGTMPAPANGDTIVIVDDGYRITVTVNGGTAIIFDVLGQYGPYSYFRFGSQTALAFDSVLAVDS